MKTYLQVIQDGPSLSINRDSGRDPSLHAIGPSKSLVDDDLEGYYEEDGVEDGD